MTKMIAITFALFFAACTTRPLATTRAGAPQTGIYDFWVGPATGSCSPPTVSGPFTLARTYVGTSTGGTVTLQMPESTVPPFTALSTRDLVDGKYEGTLGACGATDELRIVLGETSANELTATRTDVWSNSAAARGLGCTDVPAADCTTSAELHYELGEACDSPCNVKLALTCAAGDFPCLVCECPDGGAP